MGFAPHGGVWGAPGNRSVPPTCEGWYQGRGFEGKDMSEKIFKYDMMVEEALRSVVRTALRQATTHGLPGNHHFYITFKTHYPRVEVPTYLAEKYPDEMTIVLQYQFWDLEVRENNFEVMLSFNDKRERLFIPFMAVSGFADPSVKFGLQFQISKDGTEAVGTEITIGERSNEAGDQDGEHSTKSKTGDVVSLDQFRKNQ